MMSDKDCKELEKTLDNIRGPNDLEEKIRVLEFRNAKLHQHNEKIERENNNTMCKMRISRGDRG